MSQGSQVVDDARQGHDQVVVCKYLKTNQVLMIKALVLEPIGLGSILARRFLENHDFTTRHGRFGGRPP